MELHFRTLNNPYMTRSLIVSSCFLVLSSGNQKTAYLEQFQFQGQITNSSKSFKFSF